MPMQSYQQPHKTGVDSKDKVQAARQTGQVTVTVTHNRKGGRRDGLQGEGEATRKGQDGRGQALCQGRGVEKMVDRGTRGKGAGGMAAR